MNERKKIYADDEVFVQIKEKSRKAYVKSWTDFINFNIDFEFEDGHPEEEATVHQIDLQAKSCVTRSKFIFIYS